MIGIPKYQRGGGGWFFSSAIFAPQNELKRRRKFLFWERVQLAIYVGARVVAQLHQRFKINVCRYFFHHSSAACIGASLLRIFFKKRRFSSPQTHTYISSNIHSFPNLAPCALAVAFQFGFEFIWLLGNMQHSIIKCLTNFKYGNFKIGQEKKLTAYYYYIVCDDVLKLSYIFFHFSDFLSL